MLRDKHVRVLINRFAGEGKPNWGKPLTSREIKIFNIMGTANGWNGTLDEYGIKNFMRGVYNRYLEQQPFDDQLMDYLELLYCWQNKEKFNLYKTSAWRSQIEFMKKYSQIIFNICAIVSVFMLTITFVIKIFFG